MDEPIEGEVILEPSVNENTAMTVRNFSEVVTAVISEAQFGILQGRTPKKFIQRRPGKGGKTFSYVPHGYVTAVLNRAFGFDWDWEILPIENGAMYKIIPGDAPAKRKMSVLVHGRLTVRIRSPKDPLIVVATIVKAATGEKEDVPGMTWGSLVKSAESDAFKKAASRLGIALDLYWQDADEDYLVETEPDPKVIEAARAATGSPAEIAKKLSADFSMAVSVPQVLKWRAG